MSMRSSTSGWAKHLGDDDEQSSSRWVVSQREIALRSHRDVDGSQAPKKTAAAAAYDLLAGAWRRARGHPTPAAQVGAQPTEAEGREGGQNLVKRKYTCTITQSHKRTHTQYISIHRTVVNMSLPPSLFHEILE